MKGKRTLILTILFSIIFCLAIVVGAIFIANNKPSLPPPNPPTPEIQPQPILSVPQSLSVELLDSLIFSPSVENLGNYKLSVTIQNLNIATIYNGKITPKEIGTTKIISSINTNPTTIKETTLIVTDCTRQVAFYITDEDYNSVSKYYTNTNYILEIRQNILPLTLPQILYDNVNTFNLIKTENNSFFFSFVIEDSGEFKLGYKGKYIELNETFTAYNFPTDFQISFSRDVTDEINLHLYNLDYSSQANFDNLYNQISYEVITTDNLDIVSISGYDNNIITISNNKITAIKEGTTYLTFSSSLSKVNKTFKVVVQNVSLNGINVNGANKALQAIENIELNKDQIYDFNFIPNPVYAICNLNVQYNQNEVVYKNNSIKLNNDTTSSIVYIYNNQALVYTLNVTLKSEIGYNIEISQNYVNASLLNNIITATFNGVTPYLQITCTAYNKTTHQNLPVQNFEAEILNESICKIDDLFITSGIINLRLKGVGKTELIITDKETLTTIHITIIIN